MSMRIISRNIRSHEQKAVADNEEKREAATAVEVEETKEPTEVTEATKAVEVVETSEITEAAGTAEIKEVLEAVKVAEITEAVGVIEATEVKEPTEVTEATKAVEATETSEVTEAAGATEIKGVLGAVDVAETAEAVGAIEATEVEEVKEPTEETESTKTLEAAETSEVTDAADVDAVAGTAEIKGVPGAVEVTETTEAVGAIEAANVEEVKETVEMTEVTKAVEVTEISGITKAAEVEEVSGITETKEAKSVDYEALGLRSVELNPNDYPDEVIALLEPHKNNENNNSVLFYSSLGLAYKSKGRLKAAIAAYKRALKLVPSVPAPSIQYNLGIAYYYNDELHKSFNCFLNSSAQRPDHLGTEKWIKQLADELDIYKVPNTSKLKLVVNQKISVNRKKDDRESRIRMYLTQDGGRIQELSVKDKIYSYGIDSDTKRPVDYIIIDNDGDGSFDNVINTKGKFGVPTWAYNPD